MGFIFLKLRWKRDSTPEQEQEIEFAPGTPLIARSRVNSLRVLDYDPYEALENPSDMPPPGPRPRVTSNTSRVSSRKSTPCVGVREWQLKPHTALSANSVFRSLSTMFPPLQSPSTDNLTVYGSAALSRNTTASALSGPTEFASYFDFEHPPMTGLAPIANLVRADEASLAAGPMRPEGSSQHSSNTSRYAVENGEDPRTFTRLESFKAEVMRLPQ